MIATRALLDQFTFPAGPPDNGKLLSSEPHPNGNMLSSTAQLLFLERGLDPADVLWYQIGIEACKEKPGLFRRYPIGVEPRASNTTIDDYLAVACIPQHAQAIYAYGRSHFGFFNVEPGFIPKQWLWRFFGFWQHVKLSAGVRLGWVGQHLWAYAIRHAADQPVTNQDGWVQSHLMIEVWERRQQPSKIMADAVGYWRDRKTKKTSEIMAAYLGMSEHPLINAWEPYG